MDQYETNETKRKEIEHITKKKNYFHSFVIYEREK